MYSIYDAVAAAFIQPFYTVNDGAAVRSFTEAVNDENTQINKAPHDYILYSVGEFDEPTGTITAPEIPTKIMHGSECVDHERKPDIDLSKKLDHLISLMEK